MQADLDGQVDDVEAAGGCVEDWPGGYECAAQFSSHTPAVEMEQSQVAEHYQMMEDGSEDGLAPLGTFREATEVPCTSDDVYAEATVESAPAACAAEAVEAAMKAGAWLVSKARALRVMRAAAPAASAVAFAVAGAFTAGFLMGSAVNGYLECLE